MSKKTASTLLGILVMLAMFAGIEIAARVVYRVRHLHRGSKPVVQYPYHPYLGWENRPDFTYSGALARGLHPWRIRTDSLGESATPLESFPDPEVSVVVVGGSAVFGVGQTDNSFTVPSQIERELNRRTGRRVEVHNLAVGGYTSFQEMLVLERYLADHHADLIVSISGYNDAFASGIEPREGYGLLLHRVDPKAELIRSMERGDLNVLPVTAGLLLRALERASAAADLLARVAARLSPAAPPPPEWHGIPFPDSAELVRRARFTMTNYAMMDAEARQNGARFFMFLQPTAMTRKALLPAERRSLDSLNAEFMARALPAVRVFYPAAIAAPKTFEFHDLTHGFDAFGEPAFADECHFLDGATGVLAAQVCDVIAPAVADAARRRGGSRTP